MSNSGKDDNVLSKNIEHLLGDSYQPPTMRKDARRRILSELKAELPKVAEVDTATRPEPGKRRMPVAIGVGAVVIAAAAAVVLLLTSSSGPSKSQTVVQGQGAVVRHQLADGSGLILDSDANVAILGDRSIEVHSGRVWLEVPSATKSFEVVTRHGTMTTLGTRLHVAANDGETRAAVSRGSVQFRFRDQQIELLPGDEGIASETSVLRKQRAKRFSHLTSWTKKVRHREENAGDKVVRRGNLLVRDPFWPTSQRPLPMRNLTIDVHLEDQVARVAFDQTFFNTAARQLEGVYHLPLPPDAAISRLAMYVNGHLMEGGIVERQRGRQVYESIVYTRRDPALMEWMAGNAYKVRIFPLPGRTEKRLLMSYTQPMERLYGESILTVPVPAVDGGIGTLNMKLRLAGCSKCAVRSPSHALQTSIEGDDLLLAFASTNETNSDDLVLRIQDPQKGTTAVSGNDDDALLWLVRAPVELPRDRATHRRTRRWLILDDASGSRDRYARTAQAHIIERLLSEIDSNDSVSLLSFDTDVREGWTGFVSPRDVDRKELHEFLEPKTAGLGASDLRAAVTAASERLAGATGEGENYILYLGDGINTSDDVSASELADALGPDVHFVGIAVGAKQDKVVLQGLADRTQGATATFNLSDDLDWRTIDLMASLDTPRAVGLKGRWIDANGQPMKDVELYLLHRQVADGEEIVAIGRGKSVPRALRVDGSVAGEEWTQQLSLGEVKTGAGYLPRLRAQARLEELIADGSEGNQDEINKLGMANWLVTPHTSLLVLENDAMYKQFKVARSSDTGWAGYKVPRKIKVVREPGGDVATQGSTVTRVAPVYLYDPSYHYDPMYANMHGRYAVTQDEASWGDFDSLASRGLGGAIRTSRTRGWVGDHGVLGLVHSSNKTAADWSGVGLATRAAEDRSIALGTALLRQQSILGSGSSFGTIGHGGGRYGMVGYGYGKRGWRTAWYGGLQAMGPLSWAGDPGFNDLSQFVTALMTSNLDTDEIAAVSKPTQLASNVTVVLRRAREHALGKRYLVGGDIIDIDAHGNIQRTAMLNSGLREHLFFDGKELVQSYAELELTVTRNLLGREAMFTTELAPFLVLSPDVLGRDYGIELSTNEGTTTLALSGQGWLDGAQLSFDPSGRLELLRIDKTGVLFSISYTETSLQVRHGAATRTYETSTLPGNAVLAAQRADTVVSMPLQTPTPWPADQPPPPDRLHDELLATYAAQGDQTTLLRLVRHMSSEGNSLARGQQVLASMALANLTETELEEVLGRASDPIASYLRVGNRYRRTPQLRVLEALAPKGTGLMAGLSAYRRLVAGVNVKPRPKPDFARLLSHSKGDMFPRLAAAVIGNNWAWRNTALAQGMWKELGLRFPESGGLASFQSARMLYSAGKYAQAAAAFAKAYRENDDMPAPDVQVHSAFVSGGQDQAGFDLVWADWRRKQLQKGGFDALLSVLIVAPSISKLDGTEAVASRLAKMPIDNAGLALAVVEAMRGSNRLAAAERLLASSFGHGLDSAPLRTAAANIAEQQGRLADAADQLEHAYELSYGVDAPLSIIRGEATRLLSLRLRAAQGLEAEQRATQLTKARVAYDAWRVLDPDHAPRERLMATSLYAMGLDGEAWQYASTVIENHPMEGTSYDVVALVLQEQGMRDEADKLWIRAAKVEPTNPTWLLRRAQLLQWRGQKEEVVRLLSAIIDGKWHTRFRSIVDQARALKRQEQIATLLGESGDKHLTGELLWLKEQMAMLQYSLFGKSSERRGGDDPTSSTDATPEQPDSPSTGASEDSSSSDAESNKKSGRKNRQLDWPTVRKGARPRR
ncbi:MAG: hypothetical protein GY811_14470 [Myxococcales bacterium]|nr:hypothetical protein [Myxococcales bacterium]